MMIGGATPPTNLAPTPKGPYYEPQLGQGKNSKEALQKRLEKLRGRFHNPPPPVPRGKNRLIRPDRKLYAV